MTYSVKQSPFRPFRLSLWNRTFGATFLPYELERLKEISKARADNTPEVSGYVRNVGYNRFVLLPTLLTPQCYLYCICAEGVTLPRNNEYIRIFGRVRYSPHQRYSTINFQREVVVKDWIPDRPVFPEIDLSMTFRDFREDVFLKFLNVEPLVQDLIAYQMISSPPFANQIGGLNIALYDATGHKMTQQVIRGLARVIPRDIGKMSTVKTSQGGSFRIGYQFAHVRGNADRPLSSRVKRALLHKTSFRTHSEIAVSLGSSQLMPKSLTEPPVGYSDFPTILNEDADTTQRRLDPSLDAFKYLLVHQMYNPVISDTDSIIADLQTRLHKLQDSYDIPREQIARYGILDTSWWGKSSAIIKLSLAQSRTHTSQEITAQEVRTAFDTHFVKNFDYLHEVWHDLFVKGGLNLIDLSPDERKIYRIVDNHQTSDSPVPFRTIAEELPSMNEYILQHMVNDLLEMGWLVEQKIGWYATLFT